MHLTDDMTTASRSQHWSCIKTSEHPSPCSSVKKTTTCTCSEQATDTVCCSPEGFSALHIHSSIHLGCREAFHPSTLCQSCSAAPATSPQPSSLPRCCCHIMQKQSQEQLRIPNNSAEQAQKAMLPAPGPPTPPAATNLLHSPDTPRLPHQHLPNK